MTVYLLIALALMFTTTGQLLQKLAAARVLHQGGEHNFYVELLLIKETWWAMSCLGLGILVWLTVLYHMEVSKATPFLSLGFILVTLVSRYRLGEIIPLKRWFGVLLVTCGLWLVSMS
jgi:undecaprenyl phosphate-alpha-L-ara4N flippase subunit ArnE